MTDQILEQELDRFYREKHLHSPNDYNYRGFVNRIRDSRHSDWSIDERIWRPEIYSDHEIIHRCMSWMSVYDFGVKWRDIYKDIRDYSFCDGHSLRCLNNLRYMLIECDHPPTMELWVNLKNRKVYNKLFV